MLMFRKFHSQPSQVVSKRAVRVDEQLWDSERNRELGIDCCCCVGKEHSTDQAVGIAKTKMAGYHFGPSWSAWSTKHATQRYTRLVELGSGQCGDPVRRMPSQNALHHPERRTSTYPNHNWSVGWNTRSVGLTVTAWSARLP